MLQHNEIMGQRAHIAHATVVSLHALCCGLPALAMVMTAAASGVAAGIGLLARFVQPFHAFMHQHEIWILAVSAALVGVGGAFEVLARRGVAVGRFPVLFAVSVGCFIANVAIISVHRMLG
jgi:hypothetical protein